MKRWFHMTIVHRYCAHKYAKLVLDTISKVYLKWLQLQHCLPCWHAWMQYHTDIYKHNTIPYFLECYPGATILFALGWGGYYSRGATKRGGHLFLAITVQCQSFKAHNFCVFHGSVWDRGSAFYWTPCRSEDTHTILILPTTRLSSIC